MTSIQKLKELGESLGYKDTELQLFVKEQQAEERTQRNLDREAQLQTQLQADKMKMEADRTRIELERLANKQKDKDREITRLELEIKKNSLNQTSSVGLTHVASGPKFHVLRMRKMTWTRICLGLKEWLKFNPGENQNGLYFCHPC